jgi:hypothetical protein
MLPHKDSTVRVVNTPRYSAFISTTVIKGFQHGLGEFRNTGIPAQAHGGQKIRHKASVRLVNASIHCALIFRVQYGFLKSYWLKWFINVNFDISK